MTATMIEMGKQDEFRVTLRMPGGGKVASLIFALNAREAEAKMKAHYPDWRSVVDITVRCAGRSKQSAGHLAAGQCSRFSHNEFCHNHTPRLTPLP